jgi:hypothetical protein
LRHNQLQGCFYAADYPSAIKAISRAETLLWTSPAFLILADYHFYGALALAAQFDATLGGTRLQRMTALQAHHKQLEVWAETCPENFQNRYALVSAEMARLEGRELDAERLYEEAIRLAREHGFVQHEGLAHELAARFYAVRGFATIADAYLRNARSCYLRWGADGKVRQLDQLYPHLRQEPASPRTDRTLGTPVEHLDLATVVKVSQAASVRSSWSN